MKRIIYTLIALVAIFGITYLLTKVDTTTEYTAERATSTPVFFTPKVEKTDVEKARDMLAEATAKLDAEEEKLLAEIAKIKAEAEARIAELEEKVEEVNVVRASF